MRSVLPAHGTRPAASDRPVYIVKYPDPGPRRPVRVAS